MITEEEKNRCLSAAHKDGMEILKVVHSIRPFIEAYETELGQQLLKEDMSDFEKLTNEIIDALVRGDEVKQEDAIRFRILHGRLKNIAGRLAAYNKGVYQIKNIAEQQKLKEENERRLQ